MAHQTHPYPRPDWDRPSLTWTSLNGPWDFLFDDQDVGLNSHWASKGLPASVTVSSAQATGSSSNDSESITQKIASGTQELIKNNVFESGESKVNQKRKIKAPYVFQSPASGINERGMHEVLWYERSVKDLRTKEELKKGYRVLLRFGAVDYEARVWVDGQLVGGHRGGHVPFEIDITDVIDTVNTPEHRVTVRVFDSAYDLTQPRGKQYWGARPESIFYTPSGGIWQNVWLESVPSARIGDSSAGTILKADDIESGKLKGVVAVTRRVGQACSIELEARFGGVTVSKSDRRALPRDRNSVSIDLDMHIPDSQLSSIPAASLQGADVKDETCLRNSIALWSPEHPLLYDVIIRLLDPSGTALDTVTTAIGMRSIKWTGTSGHWLLNDRPYFQSLCLDQGYWPSTFMTPPSASALADDILLAKKMGLNGCRKHQKVEDPAFYYWADKLGYLVWAEMANAYQFSKEYCTRFDEEWMESVKLAVNHPSVVTWTPVNESWGYTDLRGNKEQRDHIRSLYYMAKAYDDTRPVNDNCGWEHVHTDLTTFHDYSDGPELENICSSLTTLLSPHGDRDLFVPPIGDSDPGAKHLDSAPIMCTEFGGVNISAKAVEPGTEGRRDRDWGYTTATDSEDLLKRVAKLIKGVTKGGHCCAFVYTQLTDIEQEANGLYTFDRKEKLDSAKVREIIKEAEAIYYASVK